MNQEELKVQAVLGTLTDDELMMHIVDQILRYKFNFKQVAPDVWEGDYRLDNTPVGTAPTQINILLSDLRVQGIYGIREGYDKMVYTIRNILTKNVTQQEMYYEIIERQKLIDQKKRGVDEENKTK